MCQRRLETDSVDTGGAIGAGLFVGTGEALQAGGPGSLVRAISDSNAVMVEEVLTLQAHLLFDCRMHASCDHPGPGRIGCRLPRERCFLHLLCPFYQPSMVNNSSLIPAMTCRRLITHDRSTGDLLSVGTML